MVKDQHVSRPLKYWNHGFQFQLCYVGVCTGPEKVCSAACLNKLLDISEQNNHSICEMYA
jgi:hypothetical protein